MKLSVKVIPGASSDNIAGWLGDTLKIRVQAPPEGGKANAAVIRLLAARLGIPEKRIAIVQGLTSSRKVVDLTDIDETELQPLFERRSSSLQNP